MHTKKIKNGIGILALVILAVGTIVLANRTPNVTPPAAPVTGIASSPSGSQTSTASYTLADVTQHSTASSCWTTISGSVYDLTNWISQHPGGEGPILSICGKDGTSAFEGQHANSREANAVLATFKIGTLASN